MPSCDNARITIDKTVLRMTDEDWYKVIAVNLSAAFFMSEAALPHMLERGSGRIITISSSIDETGNIGQANYAASKSGLFGLTKTLAREACFQLARSGTLSGDSIGVILNAVAPDFIATEMLERFPRRCSTGSRLRSLSDGSVGPMSWHESCTSSHRTVPRSLPGGCRA
jgi:NAD(P)-dependent dehydrogenase (short-subunit alcohol dehydrogenase family)